MKKILSIVTVLLLTVSLTLPAFASEVDVSSVVDVTAPTGSVTLTPGDSSQITINMIVTGKQDGTATFKVYQDWTLSGGIFVGSNPKTFTVDPRDPQESANEFSTTGTVSIVSTGQAAGTFILSVSAFDITNTNTTGAKLNARSDSTYTVTVVAPSKVALTVTADPQTMIYGNSDPDLTWKITSGNLAAGDTLSGSLTRVAGEDVGTYAIQKGTLSGGSKYDITFIPANLTITPRAASVTPDATSKTYGDADPALTGILSGFLVSDNVTVTYSRVSGENAGAYPISATLSSTGLLSNYTITYNTADFTINKRAATVTPDVASKTYGDADPITLTGILTGFLVSDNVTATYSRVSGENAGTYPISATLSSTGLLSNYTITYNTADFTINKRAATVTPDVASKTYGDADPITLTGILTGFLVSDNVTATYSRVSGENAGTYPISATLSSTGLLSNYTITYNTADFTINKRAASVTPDTASKTYGDADPVLTGTLTGFLAADNVTATYSRAPGDTAGTYQISATLSPSNVLSNYEITYNTANFTINPYNFSGFYKPIDTGVNVINTVKAGSAIPVKFSLNGNKGLSIFESGYPTSVSAAFSDDGKVFDPIETTVISTTTSGGSNLSYDSAIDQYTYVWKTDKSWSGYRILRVEFVDGGPTYTAIFKFSK